MDDGDKRIAPFTEEEIAGFKEFQHNRFLHPYTCSKHSDVPLSITSDYIFCGKCSYKQFWFAEVLLTLKDFGSCYFPDNRRLKEYD